MYKCQVAQTVVSDLLANTLCISAMVDPDDIIDRLVTEIRATIKERLANNKVL